VLVMWKCFRDDGSPLQVDVREHQLVHRYQATRQLLVQLLAFACRPSDTRWPLGSRPSLRFLPRRREATTHRLLEWRKFYPERVRRLLISSDDTPHRSSARLKPFAFVRTTDYAMCPVTRVCRWSKRNQAPKQVLGQGPALR